MDLVQVPIYNNRNFRYVIVPKHPGSVTPLCFIALYSVSCNKLH